MGGPERARPVLRSRGTAMCPGYPTVSRPSSHVGPVVGAAADGALQPALVVVASGDEAAGRRSGTAPVLTARLPIERERRPQVPSDRPACHMPVVPASSQEAGSESASGQVTQWAEDWFNQLGLHQLSLCAPSTTRRRRNDVKKTTGEPFAGDRMRGLNGGLGNRTAQRFVRP